MRATIIIAVCLLLTGVVTFGGTTQVSFRITYPKPNSVVSGETIEVKGVGAQRGGELKVEVLTNQWWLQDQGTSRIGEDKEGSWSYGPCYVSGQGKYNNHTIRVTLMKDGKVIASDSVAGIRRQ